MELTIATAATEMGVSQETLRRRLAEMGHDTRRGSRHPLRRIWVALGGDQKLARQRVLDAEARIRERKAEALDEDTARWSEVKAWLSNTLLPVRQRLLSLPAETCAACNPADPELARAELHRWTQEAMRIVTAHIRGKSSPRKKRCREAA